MKKQPWWIGEELCETCKYWRREIDAENDPPTQLRYGYCRKYAPRIRTGEKWPITNEKQYCGDYAISPDIVKQVSTELNSTKVTMEVNSESESTKATMEPNSKSDSTTAKTSSYSRLLRDPRWQKLRLKVFERDSWSCAWCGNKDKSLQVHHYRYVGKPWESPMEDLVTLCEEHHQFVQDLQNMAIAARRACGQSEKIFTIEELAEIVRFSVEKGGDEPWKQHCAAWCLMAKATP